MSKIIMAAGMLPLIMSGCAATSVSGMRERKPVLVADSAKDAGSVTNCVSDMWQRRGLTPRGVPRSNGATVTVEQPGIFYDLPVMVVDAETIPSGSRVTMHLFKSISGKGNRARVEEVQACL